MVDNFHEIVGTKRSENYSGANVKERAGYAPPVPDATAERPNLLGVQRWAEAGDVFFGVGTTHSALPAGIYRCAQTNTGPVLVKQRTETDNLLELPDDAGATLLAEFATFWNISPKFRQRGFLHKRGFLLWGPPGGGKTSMLMLMCKRLITEQNGFVLFLDNPHLAAQCLQMARKIEPNRPMIAIMEDLDALVRNFGENEYLALLDGEAQVDSIVFLGTTNYPELLDPRFTDRPSRFDTIRFIGMPSPAARRLYLKTKEPSLTDEDLSTWVEASDGFSVAHLKEMIIAVRCFEQPLKDVIDRLDKMRWRRPSSADSPDKRATGFLNGHGVTHVGQRLG